MLDCWINKGKAILDGVLDHLKIQKFEINMTFGMDKDGGYT